MKRFLHCGLLAAGLALAGCATPPAPRPTLMHLLERPRVPLAAQIEPVANTNGLAQWRFSFLSEAGERVPGFLLKRPDRSGRLPVVIALHGTGSSKANLLAFCRKLATNGFIAVAIDGRYHGERIPAGRGLEAYHAAIVRAAESGSERPLYYDTVWDVSRLMDWLVGRPDVDARRIGLYGISKGGIEAYLTAAADPRVAVVVPALGVQSFDWGLQNAAWAARVRTIQPAFDAWLKASGSTNATAARAREFLDRVAPGLTGEFDGPQLLPLIAPRPLLVITSDRDANTPLPGVLVCAEAARQAYQRQDAEARFTLLIQERTGHQLKPESERAALDWFARWLQP
jgi:dienelactone hydrolase